MNKCSAVRLLWSLLVIVSFSQGVVAATVITVDPNTGGRSAEPVIKTDERLGQKVTYTAKRTPLKTILADLTKMTGVTFSAGVNEDDWQVRDRKVNIFAKDLPLNQLMNSIARVMKFKWSINTDNVPTTYRLVADRRLIGKMLAEQSRKEAEMEKEAGKRRQDFADMLDKLNRMSDAEAEAFTKDNPYLQDIRKTGFAQLLGAFFNEYPGLEQSFLNRERNMNPPVSMLSPETKQLLLRVIRALWPTQHQSPFPDGMEKALEDPVRNIGFNVFPNAMYGDKKSRLQYFLGTGMQTGLGEVILGECRYPDSSLTRALGIQDQTAAGSASPVSAQDWDSAVEGMHDEFNQYTLTDPVIEHADESDLGKQICLKEDDLEKPKQGDYYSAAMKWADLGQLISKVSGFNVVSDSFNRVEDVDLNGEVKGELKELLDKYCDARNCNWEKHESVVEMRDRDWFAKRSSQIPDEWVENWSNSLKKNLHLDLDEYAQVCMLDYDQVQENLAYDPVMRTCASNIWGNLTTAVKPFLALYLRLSSTQRDMLFGKDGLDGGALSPNQWQLFLKAVNNPYIWQWDTDRFFDGRSHGLVLKGKAVDWRRDYAVEYHFTATLDDGKAPYTWYVNLPRLKLPKSSPVPAAAK